MSRIPFRHFSRFSYSHEQSAMGTVRVTGIQSSGCSKKHQFTMTFKPILFTYWYRLVLSDLSLPLFSTTGFPSFWLINFCYIVYGKNKNFLDFSLLTGVLFIKSRIARNLQCKPRPKKIFKLVETIIRVLCIPLDAVFNNAFRSMYRGLWNIF